MLAALQSALINVSLAPQASESNAAQALVLVADLIDDTVGVVQACSQWTHWLDPTVWDTVANLLVEHGTGGTWHANKDSHFSADNVLATVHWIGESHNLW